MELVNEGQIITEKTLAKKIITKKITKIIAKKVFAIKL